MIWVHWKSICLHQFANIDVKLIVFIYHVNKNGIGICKIAQNLQKFIPITPTIYNFLPKLKEVNVKICVAVDNNKKMHFLINEKIENIIHNTAQEQKHEIDDWI